MSDFESPALPRRMAAMVYDTCLVLPFIMLLVALAMGARILAGATEAEPIPAIYVQALAILGVMIFYIAFWRIKGQTLGMQAWRIQLRSFDGGMVPADRCLLRCLAALISLAPLGLGFWWCLVDPNKRYWHDHLSKTELHLVAKNTNTHGK